MLKEGWLALRSGHWPSLLGAWLHFEVSFVVWLLIGALSIPISEEFGLSASEKGILVGAPLLGRVPASYSHWTIGGLGRRENRRLGNFGFGSRGSFSGMAMGRQLPRNCTRGAYSGHCWSELCDCPADSESSLSPGPPRIGDGRRCGRQ